MLILNCWCVSIQKYSNFNFTWWIISLSFSSIRQHYRWNLKGIPVWKAMRKIIHCLSKCSMWSQQSENYETYDKPFSIIFLTYSWVCVRESNSVCGSRMTKVIKRKWYWVHVFIMLQWSKLQIAPVYNVHLFYSLKISVLQCKPIFRTDWKYTVSLQQSVKPKRLWFKEYPIFSKQVDSVRIVGWMNIICSLMTIVHHVREPCAWTEWQK